MEKQKGGLGFRSLSLFNKALLGKWSWRFDGAWCTKEVRGSGVMGSFGEEGFGVLVSRPFNDWEVEEVERLLLSIRGRRLNPLLEDRMLWKETSNGIFSVKSLYNDLASRRVDQFPNGMIWSPCGPTKVSFFAWEASWGKVLTLDQLKKRGRILANRCFLCYEEEESIDHIRIHCTRARVIWELLFALFGVTWVLPFSVRDTLIGWCGFKLGKKRRKAVWKERNMIAFDNEEFSIHRLKNSFVCNLWLWTKSVVNEGITSYFDSRGNTRDFFKIRMSILSVLIGIGMTPALPKLVQAGPPEVLSVILDGRVVGSIPSSEVETAVNHLRRLKVSAISVIPDDLEVGYIPLSMGGAYPGLYLFTSPSRFVRPVKNISIPSEEGHDIELIGPFEQVYMEIRCPDGSDGGRRNIFPATHEEIHPTGMLSVVASLTPWSDHNQSPRNMYQCQMGKQTMAFSSQAINCRADQKLYHLQTPQTPIVRTSAYVKYSMDEFPTGTNAIVAVLAYSGYDMEDAMILNKSSVDRGLCHGQIYQTETIDLSDENNKSDRGQRMFRRSNVDKSANSLIDSDGLPYVGQMINPNEPYCSIYNEVTSSTRATKLKGSEPVIVDYVALDVNIRFRRPRNPIIGDKFSSRHGQKGVCSQLWPDIDMPFSGVTGMRPDLIINPHAFPSRMTIAMLLESVAAKLTWKICGCNTIFDSLRKANGEAGSESSSLVDELGSMLTSYGFNYHGVEVLYNFIGPVYYQRLRHMVSDKFQVRSTGTVDQVTRQPIKGRKRGGGIRFGEMERDSMLAHGAAYLLHDRLHTCSDHHIADVCSLCGSILTTSIIQPQKRAVREIGGLPPGRAPKKVTCHACQTSKGMETVSMPYIFRFLAAELAAMNIKMTLQLSNGAGA
ncbi:hypothetical protein AAG906_022613 [Vitis piasezkii]